MTHSLKIRRSGAYGLAGWVVLVGSNFLPMSTPRWFVDATWLLIASFAGVAVWFNACERKAGERGTSAGFLGFAILFILVTGLMVIL